MSEHLLELLLQYKSHSSAFVRQSTLCGISIIVSTSSMDCHVLIREWLQGIYNVVSLLVAIFITLDVMNNDNDSHCRSLATEAIKLL